MKREQVPNTATQEGDRYIHGFRDQGYTASEERYKWNERSRIETHTHLGKRFTDETLLRLNN